VKLGHSLTFKKIKLLILNLFISLILTFAVFAQCEPCGVWLDSETLKFEGGGHSGEVYSAMGSDGKK
jgi:hypothetical protein